MLRGWGAAFGSCGRGVKLDGEAPSVETPPPRLGEHNEEVYGALGLSPSDIEHLRKAGTL